MLAIFCCGMTLASDGFLSREDDWRRVRRIGPNCGGFFGNVPGNVFEGVPRLETFGLAVTCPELWILLSCHSI